MNGRDESKSFPPSEASPNKSPDKASTDSPKPDQTLAEAMDAESKMAHKSLAEDMEAESRNNEETVAKTTEKPISSIPRAPKPPTELRHYGFAPEPKASEVPHDPPTYFPDSLWPRTNVILLKAQRAFSLQSQAFELCKHIISEMTPLFVEAMKAGKMKADNVQRQYGGGMEDLLQLLLFCNDGGIKGGFSNLSDTAYRLGKEVRKSDEWFAMAEAIAETEQARANSVAESQGGDQNTNEPANERRNGVDAYIDDVLQKTGTRITRRHIWEAAGYSNATEFERWQRNDPKVNSAADQNIRRVLESKPHLKPQK